MVQAQFTISGDLATFNANIEDFRTKLATKFSVVPGAVSISAVAGSVVVTADIIMADDAAAQAAATTLNDARSNPASLSTELGVTVTGVSEPVINSVAFAAPSPPPPSPPPPTVAAGTIVVAAGGTNTYPVKSINLDKASSPVWYKKYPSTNLGVSDAAACYGVPLSDGGYLFCGAGGEGEGSPYAEAFAVRLTADGDVAWKWKSGHASKSDAVIGCNQLPNGGDILVVGRYDIGGVVKRSVVKVSFTTGSQVWLAHDFGDTAGSTGAWETVEITSDKSAILLAGWHKKTDTSPMGYRSGGNTFGGQAVVMQIPVTALGATAPTSASASWTRVWAQHNAAHAARSLPSGEVAVLLWTDEDPNAWPKSTVFGSAALTKLSAAGTTLWGPINHGHPLSGHDQEGTDLSISKDGTKLAVTGHGKCSAAPNTVEGYLFCGKVFTVSVSDGAYVWGREFSSCGVPNQCQTTLIKNECWGIASTSDGYVISCGTGIENCNG